jgi:Fe-S-cluster-containing dehydrogenase component
MADEKESARGPEKTTGGRKKWVDYSKCIGCESCEAVCKHLHGLSRIQMTRDAEGVMFPLYCHHCEKPQCVAACPAGAIVKGEDGVVVHDPDRCRGCRSLACKEACPFGAIWHAGGVVPITKCDLCAERRRMGMQPACVEICPCGAIAYASEEELKKLRTPAAMAAQKRVMAHIRELKKKRKAGQEAA